MICSQITWNTINQSGLLAKPYTAWWKYMISFQRWFFLEVNTHFSLCPQGTDRDYLSGEIERGPCQEESLRELASGGSICLINSWLLKGFADWLGPTRSMAKAPLIRSHTRKRGGWLDQQTEKSKDFGDAQQSPSPASILSHPNFLPSRFHPTELVTTNLALEGRSPQASGNLVLQQGPWHRVVQPPPWKALSTSRHTQQSI